MSLQIQLMITYPAGILFYTTLYYLFYFYLLGISCNTSATFMMSLYCFLLFSATCFASFYSLQVHILSLFHPLSHIHPFFPFSFYPSLLFLICFFIHYLYLITFILSLHKYILIRFCKTSLHDNSIVVVFDIRTCPLFSS